MLFKSSGISTASCSELVISAFILILLSRALNCSREYSTSLCEGANEENSKSIILNDSDNIISFMKTCLITLNNIHTNGIIHRDIKPSNILVKSPFQKT